MKKATVRLQINTACTPICNLKKQSLFSEMINEAAVNPCCYILTVSEPQSTFEKILHFFSKRMLEITAVHFQLLSKEEGMLTIYVHIPPDKINYISHLMKNIEQVHKIELMKGREIK